MTRIRQVALQVALTVVFLAALCSPAAARSGGARGQRRPARPAPDLVDVKYGPLDRNVLDLYLAESDQPTPLVIHYHGGGFRGGDKAGVNPLLLRGLLDRGISVASANYRLTRTAPFPAQMHDAARALQFLRAYAEAYHLDPERVAAIGGSAGAGISLWLAFHDDLADPESEDPVAHQSTRLTAAVGNNAQTSYDPRFLAKLFETDQVESALIPFFGMEDGSDVADPRFHPLFAEASPLHHLTKDDAPVMLVYRQANAPLPANPPGKIYIHHPKFGEVLKEKMEGLGLPCLLRFAEDYAKKDPFAAPIEETVRFLAKRLGVPEEPSSGVRECRDLEYANVAGHSLRLDLYVPRGTSAPPPLLVWIHGGGWTRGSKSRLNPTILNLAADGYAAASVEYHLDGLASHPRQIHDVKGAIRWLRAHAEEYGYDATRIGLGGGSAGGHLSLLLGLSGGVPELEGNVGGNVDHSSRVQAVLDLFGPSDLEAFSAANERFRGRKNEALLKSASPIRYLTEDDPPLLIIHGDRDGLVPVSQSEILEKRYRAAGLEVTFHRIPGAGHGGPEFSDATRTALVKAFFDRHIRDTDHSAR